MSGIDQNACRISESVVLILLTRSGFLRMNTLSRNHKQMRASTDT